MFVTKARFFVCLLLIAKYNSEQKARSSNDNQFKIKYNTKVFHGNI